MDCKVEPNYVGEMKMLKSNIVLMLFLAVAFAANAQSERKIIREGNKLYQQKNYPDAEVNYRKALQKKQDSKYAEYNLGNALYKQEKYEDAEKQFSGIANDKNFDKREKSGAYHNLGNSFLKQKKYEESVSAYKNALKQNPKDEETRYNLAYAQAKLLKEKQQQQQKNKDQKQGKDKDQKKDDQQKQGDNKDKKDQQQKQAKPKPQKISKEDAEKILKALNNDEKEIQKKKIKVDAKRMDIEKNW